MRTAEKIWRGEHGCLHASDHARYCDHCGIERIETALREALEAAAAICEDLNSTPMECTVNIAAHRIRALKEEL